MCERPALAVGAAPESAIGGQALHSTPLHQPVSGYGIENRSSPSVV